MIRETVQTFGRACRDQWPLAPDLAYLNHGTVGVAPLEVLAIQDAIRREIESNPSAKLLREISGLLGGVPPSRLRRAAGEVGRFVGARAQDLVFVGNATEGVNAVLRSFDLDRGDAVLTTEKTYGGVDRAVRYSCRTVGAEVVVATLPCPIESPEQVVAAIADALTPKTRLAVLDHIISETGVVLPIRDLIELCHASDIRVLIDGAHAPGQVDLDLSALGADYYTANLHKWACAPRSCGILWARPEFQETLHPAVISWGLDRGFTEEFDWTGTRDTSSFLSASAGFEFLERLGVEAARSHNHELVWRATEMMIERWRGVSAAPRAMSAFMSSVQLPERFSADEGTANRLRAALLEEHRIEVPVFAWRGRLWLRLSAQVYNEFEEFERLAAAVDATP